MTVIPNGVKVVADCPAEPFETDHRVLLSVGPLKPRKGQAESMRAFARIHDRVPDVHYHLVGGGGDSEYAAKVREIAAENGIEDRVHFEGRVDDRTLERWYATADAFVLAPQYINHHFEGFGLVYLEANRHGVPTVGTVDSGARDAIDHGQSGLCVQNDVDAIAEALTTVFTDESYWNTLSQGAREWAAEHSWDRTIEQIDDEIERVLEG